MPQPQPKRANPLMRRYLDELGMSRYALARASGVPDPKLHFALYGAVSARNAERISRFVAEVLGLSEMERLELKAEIMGRPGELVYAYFGTIEGATASLGVSRHTAIEVLTPGAEINGNAREDIERNLEETPDFIAEEILSRIGAPRGNVTHRARGLEGRNRRARTRTSLLWGKPETHEAIKRSGLSMKDLRQSAGVSKETLRKALYEHVGSRSAGAIARVLAETSGLSRSAREAVERELTELPRTKF
jgi:lambda repressor-like predicted transcriptional regulator